MKKTILVTGGAGFIGAWLVDRLLEDHNVVIVDNLRSVGGISYINPGAEFLNYNICDQELYKELDKYEFDGIYHLAAQSAGESAYDDPKYDVLTNSYGTWRMAKYCAEKGIKKFIYTSTVAVYGSGGNDGFSEDSDIAPDSIYGVSKFSGELFVKQIFKDTDTDFVIFRLFNTYGPGENLNYRKKGMVSIYASYLWRNEPVLVKGAVTRYRDFTYIEDTVDVLSAAYHNQKAFGETYNLSSGGKMLIKDLLKVMIRVSGKEANYEIIEADSTPGDSFGTHADIKKLKNDFEWDPKYAVEEGLVEYFEWINRVPVSDDISGYHPLNMGTGKVAIV